MLVFPSKIVFNIINDKCLNTLVFLKSQLKLIKKTEKLELNMNIELGRAVLSTISANEMIVSN